MELGSKRLIVNADDLGRTPGINAGIFEAHSRGLVTSATLMVGFAAAVDAAAQLPRYPDLGVGLHVTLTGAEPLLPADQLPSLVDEAGRFPSKPEGHGVLDPQEVQAEVEAQLSRFRGLTGRLPTHLDSHHHSHRLPVICDSLIAVASRLNLPVRDSGPEVGQRLFRAGVRTTDVFIEEFFGPAATLDVLQRILTSLQIGTTEVMCHPAVIDELLRQGSSYVHERETELEVLTDLGIKQLVADEGILLTHFGSV